VDDILTTGTTAKAIAECLREKFPTCPIKLFTLAYVSLESFINLNIQLNSITYEWSHHTGWQVQEDDAYYISLKSLRLQIENNFSS